jgi:hypothetical protein
LANKWSFIVEIFEFDPVPAFRVFAKRCAQRDVALLGGAARARSAASTAADPRSCFRTGDAITRDASSIARSNCPRRVHFLTKSERQRYIRATSHRV